ncbi:MAG: hypothetical protein KC589_06885 [Nanoarchaeota archaeon]|nr:hypothetical protein [Nanoarchaeota archaeon]
MIQLLVIYKNKPTDRKILDIELEEFIYRFFPSKKKFISSIYLITDKDSVLEKEYFLYGIAQELIDDFDKNISLLTKAKELLVENKILGIAIADDSIQKERKETCHKNICKKYDSENNKCLACGCNISTKIVFLSSYCPKNLWKT